MDGRVSDEPLSPPCRCHNGLKNVYLARSQHYDSCLCTNNLIRSLKTVSWLTDEMSAGAQWAGTVKGHRQLNSYLATFLLLPFTIMFTPAQIRFL